MIRSSRRSLPWFGAVAALLLLALPAQADGIEPEPYVEEEVVEPEPDPVVEPEPEAEAREEAETQVRAAASSGPSVGSKIFDCAVLRPFGLVKTIAGGAFFVPAAALASGVLFVPPTMLFDHRYRAHVVEGTKTAWEHFVAQPAENTFTRPLGEF
jgi:hypothetical protein